MELSLNSILELAKGNGLVLNPSTCSCIAISRSNNDCLEPPQVLVDNNAFKFVKHVKNLGIIFDQNLSWNMHVNKKNWMRIRYVTNFMGNKIFYSY